MNEGRNDDERQSAAEGERGGHAAGVGAVAGPPGAAEDAPADGAADAGAAAADDEVSILRSELQHMQEQLEEVRREATENHDRFLRSRAELETYRRRVAADVERAREAGLDSAVLAVLTVFDDLGRALEAAESSEDPATIMPGVRAVKEALERHLEGLDIRRIGRPGEPFDPNEHEALTAVPPTEGAQPGTIANVFQAGFKRGERLVRPARVVVYKEPE